MQEFKMVKVDDDKEAEKIKMSLVDGGNHEDEAKEIDEELNSKETLSGTLAKQNDMSGDIKNVEKEAEKVKMAICLWWMGETSRARRKKLMKS